jgi:hypothetical protein
LAAKIAKGAKGACAKGTRKREFYAHIMRIVILANPLRRRAAPFAYFAAKKTVLSPSMTAQRSF